MRLSPSGLPWQASQWRAVSAALRQNRLAHALLLVGARGVGKRIFTAQLAQALLCAKPMDGGQSCGKCQSCAWARAGTHPDLFRLEKAEGGKVVKVDDLREFNRKIFLTPQMGRGIVGIIDPVDGLNRNSANALLKSLEEPPRGSHILLVGERWMTLPATLRSRCLILRFPTPPASEVVQWLERQSPEASELLPLRMRYAANPAGPRTWTESLTQLCIGKEDPVALAERWQKSEEELPALMDWMQICLMDLLKLKCQASETTLAYPQSLQRLQTMAARLSEPSLQALAQLSVETRRLLESQAKPQMLLENLLVSWYQSTVPGSTRQT